MNKAYFLIISIIILVIAPVIVVVLNYFIDNSIIDIFADPGIILLLTGTVLSCAIGNGFKGFKNAIGLAIAENGKFTSRKDVKQALITIKFSGNIIIEWGILLLLLKIMVGLVTIMSKDMILPELGKAFIPLIYALIIRFTIFNSLSTRLHFKYAC